MYIEGREQLEATPLGDIENISVTLPTAGIGIDVQPIGTPQLWLADSPDCYAIYDEAARTLQIAEHRRGIAVRSTWPACPLAWLNLPETYQGDRLQQVDIEVRGGVYLGGLSATMLMASTYGMEAKPAVGEMMRGIEARGVHIGAVGLFKTVEHFAVVSGLVAPESGDGISPQFRPTADIISVKGGIRVTDSKAAWRLYGSPVEVDEYTTQGPRHISYRQQVRRASA